MNLQIAEQALGENEKVTEIDLEKLHKVQLEMALEVKRICNKNNIKYFLIAGTLLGAIRHQGFIPWDDDIDIGMLREDYDKFINACNNDLSSKYFLQTWDTDFQFGLPIAKIRKNNTKFIERVSKDSDTHKGIFIDIFPYDNVPDNKIQKECHKWLAYIYKRLVLIKSNHNLSYNKSNIGKIIILFLKLLAKMLPKKYLVAKYLRLMKKYNAINHTDKITLFGGSYTYEKESIQRGWITDTETICFENELFSIPKEPHLMLSSIYGDYMQLPPEDKRYNRHDIIEIDYGGIDI